MARTSKTKVSGGPRQDTMMRAQEQGSAAETRAREQLIAQRERGAAGGQRGLQAAAQMIQAQQQQESMLAAREAEGARERQFRGEQAAAEREQRGQLAEQQAGLAREQMDLRAAQSGLQRAPAGTQAQGAQPAQAEQQGPPMAPEQGPPMDPELQRRQQALEAEMQRGQQQATAPGELDGQRFVPTEAARQAGREKADIARMRAATELGRIEVMRQNSLTRARSAAFRADEGSYKAAKEDYASHIRKLGARADRIIKAQTDPRSQITSDDVSYLKRLAEDNPDQELQAELSSGQLGPASARFLRGKILFDSLDFVAERGDWPDPDSIDEAHPMYQEFQRHVANAGQLLKQRQQVGGIVGIQSLAYANRIKRRLAAITMKEIARRRRQLAAMGGGGSQPLPSAPGLGAQNVEPGPPANEPLRENIGAGQPYLEPPAWPPVTPVERPQLNLPGR